MFGKFRLCLGPWSTFRALIGQFFKWAPTFTIEYSGEIRSFTHVQYSMLNVGAQLPDDSRNVGRSPQCIILGPGGVTILRRASPNFSAPSSARVE